jgi:hypothetical protein
VKIVRKDKNVTASALFGVAAIQLIIAGIDWFLHGFQRDRFGWIDWLFPLSGVIYIALGIAARRIRLLAAIIGGVLYAAFLVGSSDQWFIFNIPVMMFLLVAVMSALKRPPAETGV